MAKYDGRTLLISGIRPQGDGTYPLVDAKDIQVNENETKNRLSDALLDIKNAIGDAGSGTSLSGRLTTAEGKIETLENTTIPAIDDRVETLEDAVGSVQGVMHYRGVFNNLNEVTNPVAGDVAVVGDKEYVYNEDLSTWQEFGDVSAEGTRLTYLENTVGLDANSGLRKAVSDNTTAIGTINTTTIPNAKSELIGQASDAKTANTINAAKNFATDAVGIATNNLIGTASDVKTADTINGAKNFATDAVGTATTNLIGTTADTSTADTINGAKAFATSLGNDLDGRLDTVEGQIGTGDTSGTILYRLEELEYQPVSVGTFNALDGVSSTSFTSKTFQKGTVLNAVKFNWRISGTKNLATLTLRKGSETPIDVVSQGKSKDNYAYSGTVNATSTFTLAATDTHVPNAGTSSKSVTFNFYDAIYYGMSTNDGTGSVAADFITDNKLTPRVVSQTDTHTYSFSSVPNNSYICFAVPRIYKAPKFYYMNAELTSMVKISPSSALTTIGSYSTNYDIYVYPKTGLSAVDIEIR